MIDVSEKFKVQLAFELQSSCVFEKHRLTDLHVHCNNDIIAECVIKEISVGPFEDGEEERAQKEERAYWMEGTTQREAKRITEYMSLNINKVTMYYSAERVML